jgi:hypothetical protein
MLRVAFPFRDLSSSCLPLIDEPKELKVLLFGSDHFYTIHTNLENKHTGNHKGETL